MKTLFKKLLFVILPYLLVSCQFFGPKLGSKDLPVNFIILNSTNLAPEKLDFSHLTSFFEKEEGLYLNIKIIDFYEDVGSLFKDKNNHLGLLSAQFYAANMDQIPVTADLISVRLNKTRYRSGIIARVDSGIEKLEDLNGKTFAFTHKESASGYLIPELLFQKHNIQLKSYNFVGEHAMVAEVIYKGNFDAGATFYDESGEGGEIQDGRTLIKKKFPDVLDKVKVIYSSGEIPYDPFIFHESLTLKNKAKLINSLKHYFNRYQKENIFYKYFKIENVNSVTSEEFRQFKNDFLKND